MSAERAVLVPLFQQHPFLLLHPERFGCLKEGIFIRVPVPARKHPTVWLANAADVDAIELRIEMLHQRSDLLIDRLHSTILTRVAVVRCSPADHWLALNDRAIIREVELHIDDLETRIGG